MNEELLEMLRPFAKMVAEELVKVMPQFILLKNFLITENI